MPNNTTKACDELGFNRDPSEPNVSQTNGYIERWVRQYKEGTRCVLVQSGLALLWWREAALPLQFLGRAQNKKLMAGSREP